MVLMWLGGGREGGGVSVVRFSSMHVWRSSTDIHHLTPTLPPSLLPFVPLKQFCGVLILYAYLLELSPMQYLYADLFVVLPFVTFMPSMEATPKLTRGTPETNLVSFPVMRSIFGHSALIIFFQLFQQWLLLQQDWYHGPDYDAPNFDRQVRFKEKEGGREGGCVQYLLARLFPITSTHSSLPPSLLSSPLHTGHHCKLQQVPLLQFYVHLLGLGLVSDLRALPRAHLQKHRPLRLGHCGGGRFHASPCVGLAHF